MRFILSGNIIIGNEGTPFEQPISDKDKHYLPIPEITSRIHYKQTSDNQVQIVYNNRKYFLQNDSNPIHLKCENCKIELYLQTQREL